MLNLSNILRPKKKESTEVITYTNIDNIQKNIEIGPKYLSSNNEIPRDCKIYIYCYVARRLLDLLKKINTKQKIYYGLINEIIALYIAQYKFRDKNKDFSDIPIYLKNNAALLTVKIKELRDVIINLNKEKNENNENKYDLYITYDTKLVNLIKEYKPTNDKLLLKLLLIEKTRIKILENATEPDNNIYVFIKGFGWIERTIITEIDFEKKFFFLKNKKRFHFINLCITTSTSSKIKTLLNPDCDLNRTSPSGDADKKMESQPHPETPTQPEIPLQSSIQPETPTQPEIPLQSSIQPEPPTQPETYSDTDDDTDDDISLPSQPLNPLDVNVNMYLKKLKTNKILLYNSTPNYTITCDNAKNIIIILKESIRQMIINKPKHYVLPIININKDKNIIITKIDTKKELLLQTINIILDDISKTVFTCKINSSKRDALQFEKIITIPYNELTIDSENCEPYEQIGDKTGGNKTHKKTMKGGNYNNSSISTSSLC